MPKIPVVKGEAVVRAFKRAGFVLDRISGSHHILKKPGCTLSVPVHAGKDYKRNMLRSQIENAGLTVEQFISYLK